MRHLSALAFGPAHPYGHTTIGSMADLDAATAERAAAFFANHYRPDNAVLTLVGDVTGKDGVKRADRAFGHLPSWNPRRRPPLASLPPLSGVPTVGLSGRVPAAATYFAWRLPPRDTPGFDACDLALAVLGGGQTSRLHRELVRNHRVAASAGASALPLIGGNSLGLVHLRAIPGETADAATASAISEIARLAESGPTQSELARAKAQYTREWLTELSGFDSRADLISAYTTLHDDPGSGEHPAGRRVLDQPPRCGPGLRAVSSPRPALPTRLPPGGDRCTAVSSDPRCGPPRGGGSPSRPRPGWTTDCTSWRTTDPVSTWQRSPLCSTARSIWSPPRSKAWPPSPNGVSTKAHRHTPEPASPRHWRTLVLS